MWCTAVVISAIVVASVAAFLSGGWWLALIGAVSAAAIAYASVLDLLEDADQSVLGTGDGFF